MKLQTIKVGFLETNCYLLESEENLLIIDPGGDSEKIIKEITKNYSSATIINTHYHFDHTLANKEIKEKLNAKIFIHEDEKPFIDFKPDKFLKEGDNIKIGDIELEIIHTPGHSQGCICLLNKEKGILFSGDTLFYQGYGRTDLPGGDSSLMVKSLKKLDDILKKGTMIYPGHGEAFAWKENS